MNVIWIHRGGEIMAKKKKSQKGKTILRHPERSTIDKMLLSGWSPSRIHEWLVEKGKDTVSAPTLSHYRDNFLDAKMILPPSTYEKKLKQLSIQIDLLRELYNLIEIQKRRLGYLLESEESYKRTHPDTRQELQLLRDTIVKAIDLEMDLGIRKKAAIEIHEKKFDMAELLKQFMLVKEERALKAVIEK